MDDETSESSADEVSYTLYLTEDSPIIRGSLFSERKSFGPRVQLNYWKHEDK